MLAVNEPRPVQQREDITISARKVKGNATYPAVSNAKHIINIQEAERKAQDKKAALEQSISRELKQGHGVYITCFTWDETKTDGGYNMPYCEIRKQIMLLANEEVTKLQVDPAYADRKILFRWIDRDCRHDTMGLIPIERLISAANDTESTVISGGYLWDVAGNTDVSEDRKEEYTSFINVFNQEELRLRQIYHLLKQNLVGNGAGWEIARESSFYLPETTLIMNKQAHKSALEQLNPSGENDQSRESMTALERVSPKVIFAPEFQAYKPNKSLTAIPKTLVHRFAEKYLEGLKLTSVQRNNFYEEGAVLKVGGTDYKIPQKERYLKQLEALFPKTEKNIVHYVSEDVFLNALKNTRQSVFNNKQWNFCNEQWCIEWETPMTRPVGALQLAQEQLNEERRHSKNILYLEYTKNKR